MKAAETKRRGRKSPAARPTSATDRPSRRPSSGPGVARKSARSTRGTPNASAPPARRPQQTRRRKPAWNVPALLLEGDPVSAPCACPPTLPDPLLGPLGMIDLPIATTGPEPMTLDQPAPVVPVSEDPGSLIRAANERRDNPAPAFPVAEDLRRPETAIQMATIPFDADISVVELITTAEAKTFAPINAQTDPESSGVNPSPLPGVLVSPIPTPDEQDAVFAEYRDELPDLVSRLFDADQPGAVGDPVPAEATAGLAPAEVPVGLAPASGTAPAEAVSSPTAAMGKPGNAAGFWFNLNAELVIYGATERDAQVVIGGRLIPLRPDGTFSLRYALPDGHHDLTAAATSAGGAESRSVQIHFSRATHYCGQAESLPPNLDLPTPS